MELSGCSGTSSNSSSGSGGNSNDGGATSSSSSATTGGANAQSSGGATAATSIARTATLVGASSAAGGSVTSGGTAASAGGAKTAGGFAGTGGKAAAGGGATTGGATTNGGAASGGATSVGGSKASGGNTSTAGGSKAAGGTAATAGSGTGGSTALHVSVLQHHNHANRDGVYVDAAITTASAANLHIDASFAAATIAGPTYAQPLYLAAKDSGPDLVIAVTEQNRVYAFNAATSNQIYNVQLGTPLPRSQIQSLRSNICGNIDPLGITGTPILDDTTRTIYLDTMQSSDATAANARHKVYALNADTGATLAGWPVDLNAKVPTTAGSSFDSLVQNQRGALALLGGKVFVPFGGHVGDCGSYHGWIIGISTTDPTQVSAWTTRALAGGIWAPGGLSSDGTSLFAATGNTEANPNNFSAPGSWQDGEAIFRFAPSLAAVTATSDYFVPMNWTTMDAKRPGYQRQQSVAGGCSGRNAVKSRCGPRKRRQSLPGQSN